MNSEKTIKELLELLLVTYNKRVENYNTKYSPNIIFLGLCATVNIRFINCNSERSRLLKYLEENLPNHIPGKYCWPMTEKGVELRKKWIEDHIKKENID